MTIKNCMLKYNTWVGVSEGFEFQSRKIKEVRWDDGICYQGFFASKEKCFKY